MSVCSLRVITTTNGHSVPLSGWDTYTVAKDNHDSEAFTIKACMAESERGAVSSWGATSSAIKAFLQNAQYRGIHVVSQTGTCHVNVALKSEKENSAIKKIESMVELTPVAGQIYSGFKFMVGVMNLRSEPEVMFSITAVPTDDTKFTFNGKQTLLQVYYAAVNAKAFACADKTIVQKAAAVGELVANALGPAGGVVADVVGAAAQVAVPAVNAASAAVKLMADSSG
jgi:hypothetical protein